MEGGERWRKRSEVKVGTKEVRLLRVWETTKARVWEKVEEIEGDRWEKELDWCTGLRKR